MNCTRSLFLITSLVGALAPASAASIVINPLYAISVIDSEPDGTFEGFMSGLTITPTSRPIMEFDLASLPTGATILSAVLDVDGLSTQAAVLGEMKTTHAFVGDGTAATNDATIINVIDTSFYDSFVPLDVTSFVTTNANAGFLGFSIHSTIAPGNFGNTGVLSSPPTLTIEISMVPEPHTLGLIILSSVPALMTVRRRSA